jgi:archaellum component FlaC
MNDMTDRMVGEISSKVGEINGKVGEINDIVGEMTQILNLHSQSIARLEALVELIANILNKEEEKLQSQPMLTGYTLVDSN